MGYWPTHSQSPVYVADPSTTTVSSSASANTKGSWTLIETADENLSGIILSVRKTTAADAFGFFDIGLTTSNHVIAENLSYGELSNNDLEYTMTWLIPVPITSGTAIRARIQDDTASAIDYSFDVTQLRAGSTMSSLGGISKIEALGADTTDSGGIHIDPGGTSNVWSSWTEVVSSSANDYKAIGIGWHNWSIFHGYGTSYTQLQVGVGANPNEEAIIPSLGTTGIETCDYWADRYDSLYGPYPVWIPAGTRISARSKSTIANTPDREVEFVLYGYR